MIFRIYAGTMFCGLLTVGVVGHVMHLHDGSTVYRLKRIARIAGYKKLTLRRVYWYEHESYKKG